ncbi:nickel ABC transporter permease subunit NikC (plasmid) [Roseomonas marmotae]|uniref:Nickel ABC transporter permease subunit NikC n=2 Tax=Roseomonas marmotae TaxID=2768161 RepID=A0ABS3KFG3_9PROT|nr:nickel ABC transporter permease subunit NikC [Roseomonas marmotae]QTI82034.1 nickel ABC transporter permease subunit NikC [Roseomonas marmotae]
MLRAGLALLALLVCAALLAPWIVPFDPAETDLARRLMPPSATHWLGTDHLGRDLLSRLLWGARTSLGAVAVILALVLSIGTVLGCLAGLLGGWVDAVLMRLADIFMTVPTLVLALFFIGALGTGMTNVIIAIALSHWAFYARLVRGLTLSLRAREHAAAARVAGASRLDIARRHVLPAMAGQLAVLAGLDLGHWMLHVAGLSFLGLGMEPPTAEWGIMINDARPFFRVAPMLVLLPGAAILLTVIGFNLLGDALRDRLDPFLEHSH